MVLVKRPHINTWYFVYTAHSSPLHPSPTLEKASFCLWWAIEREAVGGCVVATGKAMLYSCQSGLCNSHYHGKHRKCFRLMFWKCFLGSVLSVGRQWTIMSGYLCLTSVMCRKGPVRMLHKGFYLWNRSTKLEKTSAFYVCQCLI